MGEAFRDAPWDPKKVILSSGIYLGRPLVATRSHRDDFLVIGMAFRENPWGRKKVIVMTFLSSGKPSVAPWGPKKGILPTFLPWETLGHQESHPDDFHVIGKAFEESPWAPRMSS